MSYCFFICFCYCCFVFLICIKFIFYFLLLFIVIFCSLSFFFIIHLSFYVYLKYFFSFLFNFFLSLSLKIHIFEFKWIRNERFLSILEYFCATQIKIKLKIIILKDIALNSKIKVKFSQSSIDDKARNMIMSKALFLFNKPDNSINLSQEN